MWVPCPDCAGGAEVATPARIDVDREPHHRAALLDGRLGGAPCLRCGAWLVGEAPLVWIDGGRGLVVGHLPREQIEDWARHEAEVDAAWFQVALAEAPPAVAHGVELRRRLVFGHDELREKVVCFDTGLDDRVLEVLKLQLLHARLQNGVGTVGLLLVEVDAEQLWFRVRRPGDDLEILAVGRGFYDQLAARAWAWRATVAPLFAGTYVNAVRCAWA